ncbi:unnamed protein product [Microthlaspi erraticum]|uniref:Uncharacterized protein n=1 Tax=Microthlaspi erraticum TaxID=1685480 RepID=A0A6D2IFY3_9BRAS|nr:unnamed protein product [Microthlaspi erraticum]
MHIKEESEKGVEKECEQDDEKDWEQSGACENESDKAPAENESEKTAEKKVKMFMAMKERMFNNGRLLALKWLEKEYEQQFAHIRGDVQEILGNHENTTVIVETYQNLEKQDVFTWFYVCFEKLRRQIKTFVVLSLA